MFICKCNKEFSKAQSLNAHYRHCLIHRNGRPVIPPGNKGKISLIKGKSLEEQHGIEKANQIKQKLSTASKNRIISNKTRIKLSLSRIKVLENSPHIKWFIIDNIKVQGKWEQSIAIKLFEAGIKFERVRLTYDNTRHYTPDFYIPSLDIFIEIKGWLRIDDIIKYQKVIKEHSDKVIKVLYGKNNVFSFNINTILTLPNLEDILPR